VLPFYGSIEEQNHRKSYAYGEIYPLYVPVNNVPPFQVVIAHTDATISSVQLYTSKGVYVSTITAFLTAKGLTKYPFAGEGYDVLVYPALASETTATIAEGQYYLTITMSDDSVLYSDIFTCTGMISAYLKVQWWDVADFVMDGCRIVYPLGENSVFQNTLYLNTELGKPEYEFNEEGEQRDGYFFSELQISEKKYKATFLASEYLCDVMRFIRMADYVKITDKYGNIYRADTFLITPKWEAQGNLASVDMEFTCDTVAKKIARPVSSVGDFNEDYNESFFN
jgi:hypothetical protein